MASSSAAAAATVKDAPDVAARRTQAGERCHAVARSTLAKSPVKTAPAAQATPKAAKKNLENIWEGRAIGGAY